MGLTRRPSRVSRGAPDRVLGSSIALSNKDRPKIHRSGRTASVVILNTSLVRLPRAYPIHHGAYCAIAVVGLEDQPGVTFCLWLRQNGITMDIRSLHPIRSKGRMIAKTDDEVKNSFWIEAWMQEYKAMREETVLALTAQQHILQWSMAGLSALLAGGLVYLNGYATDPTAVHLTVSLIIFGVVIPGVAFCGNLAWWGEVFRMERSGIHVRGMEMYLSEHLRHSSPFEDEVPPLRFTMTISFGSYKKIKEGYLGALGIFVGVFTLSQVTFFVLLSQYGERLQWIPYLKAIATLYPLLSILVMLSLGLYFSRQFYKRSCAIADMSGPLAEPT